MILYLSLSLCLPSGFCSGPWGGSDSGLRQPADGEWRGLRRCRRPARVAPPVAVAAVCQWGRPAGVAGLPGAQHPAERQPAAGAAPQWGDGQRGRPARRRSCWGRRDPGGEGGALWSDIYFTAGSLQGVNEFNITASNVVKIKLFCF